MRTLREYESMIEGKKCVSCGRTLIEESSKTFEPPKIEHYEHPEGWSVFGLDRKQWLYVTCSHCGYQNSLVKLGVGRDE